MAALTAVVVSGLCVLGLEVGFRSLNGIAVGGDLPLDVEGHQVVRTFRKSANPLLVYELIPMAESNYMGVVNSINSDGMRDREYAHSKPSGGFRIAVLGDSVVYGFGLSASKTFPKILERLLERKTPGRFEVLSFGVPGYSTQQETEAYRTSAKRFDPDLVLVGYTLNDEYETSLEIDLFRDRHFSILRKLYWVDFLAQTTRTLTRGWFDETFPSYHRETRVAQDFARLRNVVGDYPPIAVVVFPFLMTGVSERFADRYRRIETAATEQGFPLIDLREAFAVHEPEQLRVFPNDIEHPNALANRMAARTTLDFMNNHDLLDLEKIPVVPQGATVQ